MMQHIPKIIPGVLGGFIFCGISYWFVFPSGIHINFSRGETCYWLFLLTASCFIWRTYVPAKIKSCAEFDKQAGYWRVDLNIGRDVCFATYSERDKVPKPRRIDGQQLVGRTHCIVEDRFWVWYEEKQGI
jgi:hypothetical protein